MWAVGKLQIHGICSHRLVHREALRLYRILRELGMFDNYYIDHITFNIITILFLTKSNSVTEVATTLL